MGRDSADFLDALRNRDRLVQGARLLPTDGPPSDQQTNDVRAAFRDRLKASRLAPDKVARQLEVSVDDLTDWVAGRGGPSESLTRAVNLWVARESRRAADPSSRAYVSTRVAEDMRAWINLADAERMMCAIVGPSGCGKTLVLQAVKDELNGLYLALEDSMSPVQFLRRLAAYLGLASAGRMKDQLHLRVVEYLRQTRRVVLIDEAQNLQTKTLSTVRAIHDQAGVTIVMAGSAEFLDRLDDRADGRGQFYSRCVCLNLIDRDGGDDGTGPHGNDRGTNLFSVDEVRAFFDRRAVRLQRDALDLLWALACLPGFGSFRVLERVASFVRRACPDRVLSREDVRGVLKIILPRDLRAVERMADLHLDRTRPTRTAATAG